MMLFRLFWSILKNIWWIFVISIAVLTGYAIVTNYQTVQQSIVGQVLKLPEIHSFTALKQYIAASSTPTVTPMVTPTIQAYPNTVKVVIHTAKGDIQFTTETAQTPEKRELGLMYRTSLPSYGGMLFIFEYSNQYPFWMKNCEIPLDIIFINDTFSIIDIKAKVPPCKKVDPTQQNCPLYQPKDKYLYALELVSGTTAQSGIAVGNTIEINK